MNSKPLLSLGQDIAYMNGSKGGYVSAGKAVEFGAAHPSHGFPALWTIGITLKRTLAVTLKKSSAIADKIFGPLRVFFHSKLSYLLTQDPVLLLKGRHFLFQFVQGVSGGEKIGRTGHTQSYSSEKDGGQS